MPADKPTRNEFAMIAIERLTQAGEQRRIEFDEAEFQLVFIEKNGNVSQRKFLHRPYDEFLRTPLDARRDWWAKFVRVSAPVKELTGPFDKIRKELFPQIRLRSYFDSIALLTAAEGQKPPKYPLAAIGEHLALAIVHDTPDEMRYIDQGCLEEWKTGFRDLLAIARKNLDAIEPEVMTIDDRIFTFVNQDSYDCARLLSSKLIRSIELKGDPIAVLPNRDVIYIAGSNDDDGIELLAEVVEQSAKNEPDLMSPVPLRFADNKWETWLPPQNHRAYPAFRRLHVQFLFGEYETQKDLLDKMHKKLEIDIFVASFKAMATAEGRCFSYASWTKGAVSLIPRVDEIVFVDLDAQLHWDVAWDQAMPVVGHRMQPDPKRFPPRWLVESFPTPAEFQKLGIKPAKLE